jgi:hypothetical protein
MTEILQKKFDWAVENNDVDSVLLLLTEPFIDPSLNLNLAIRKSANYNNVEMFEILLNDHRVDPTDSDNFAFRVAVQKGHFDIFKLLINHEKIKPLLKTNNSRISNRQTFFMAAQKNHLSIIKEIVNQDKDIFNHNNSDELNKSFYNACKNNCFSVVKFIIDEFNINPSDNLNHASYMADSGKSYEILDLFWEDKRVQKSLKNDKPFIYKEQLVRNKINKIKNTANNF